MLCGAGKLTPVAFLHRDPVVPVLTGIQRVSSQSILSRFFAEFDSAGKNLSCFGPILLCQHCANNTEGFPLEVLGRLPKWLKVPPVRADSGFCENGRLSLLEGQGLSGIVVVWLMTPLRKLIVKGMG